MTEYNYYSSVDLIGKILCMSTPEEASKTEYYYLRVLFRDKGSPAKFINVFCWDTKQDVIDLALNIGDVVRIQGELAFVEKDGKAGVHSIRAKQITMLSRKAEARPTRMKLGF